MRFLKGIFEFLVTHRTLVRILLFYSKYVCALVYVNDIGIGAI